MTPPAGAAWRVSLIGAGHVGQTLGRLWHDSGRALLVDVLAPHLEHARRAVAFIGAGRALSDYALLEDADVFVVVTPDRALEAADIALAARLARGATRPIVFHASGACSSTVLAACGRLGAARASAHPLTSFAQPVETLRRFAGVVCAIEGDARAAAVASALYEAIGARPLHIGPDDKLLYHAAAVFASNYLTTLVAAAFETYALIGIQEQDALTMLGPLIDQTVANVLAAGPKAALSGPIARGDAALVRRQYAALAARDADLGALYRSCAARAARLAGRADPLADTGPAGPGSHP